MSLGVVRVLGSRLALGLFLCAFTAHASDQQVVQGVITKITDGDTVNVSPDQRTVLKIRMLGIDAPETHFPTTDHGVVGQQPWGDNATAYLQGFLKVGNSVTLQTWGTDRYKRTLGFVFFKQVDINLQMVRGGWAVPYIYCTGPSCTREFFKNNRVREYLMSCDAARKEHRGIYSATKPLKEMPFEFRMRMSGRQADKYVGDYDTMTLHEPDDYKGISVCRRIFFSSKSAAHKIGFKDAQ